MRITNSMVLRNALAGLQGNKAAVQKLQSQIASGVRLSTASDDPTAAEQVMGAASSLGAIDQYKRNISTATSRNDVEESAFGQVTNLLTRARELMVAQSTATSTAATRQIASKEMESIYDSVVAIGNTKFGESYLFGGETSTTAPFAASGTGATLDFTSTNPVGSPASEVGTSQTLASTHDGTQAFLSSGVLASLRDATRALATNDVPASLTAITGLEASFQQVQVLTGENGATRNTLDMAAQNLQALKTNLTSYRSSLEDIDIEAVVTTLVTKQTAYQAAMAATSKVLGMSLTDYIR
ncbi:MAG: flagellar hook-associated protein FlgL [bacterium]